MKLIIEVDATDKEADDIVTVIVDYLIHVEGVTVTGYWVEK
jgi:hypothetical protein